MIVGTGKVNKSQMMKEGSRTMVEQPPAEATIILPIA